MDLLRQAQEMMKSFIDSQQQMVENIAKTLQSAGASLATGAWDTTITAWERAVKGFLAAQTGWTTALANVISSAPNLPEQVGHWSQQFKALAEISATFQGQFWDGWFTMLRKIDPKNPVDNLQGNVQSMVDSWRDTMQKIISIQAEWLRSVADQMAAKPQNESDSPEFGA